MPCSARRVAAGTLLCLGTLGVAAGPAAAAGRPTTPPPFASGTVAALAPSSMEVQNPQSGQTTVNWTTATAFSRTVTVGVGAVVAGDCVTVSGTTAKKVLTARTISIEAAPTGEKCGGARTTAGGPAGGIHFSTSGRPPSGTFTFPRGAGAKGGAFPRPAADLGFASGKVTSASATQLVLSGFSSTGLERAVKRQAHGGKKDQKSSRSRVRPKPATVLVRLGSSTAVEKTQPAAPDDLAVGDCVTATGTSDSTGAIAATSVHMAIAGPNGCSGGFDFQDGGPGGPGAVIAGG